MSVIENEPFDLSEEGSCHKYEGWRYLFTIYGRSPEKSSEDQNFGWLYPNDLSNKSTVYSVLMKETRSPETINPKYKIIATSGGFSAYILKH